MNTILEKFVEAELFNEPMRAYFNGFDAYQEEAFGCQVQRMRQVQLEPYGIADIVNIFHADQERRTILIQVIECKRDMVNLATYAQAKRYLAALKVALADFVAKCAEVGFCIEWECILVGHRIDRSSDFVFVLNDDQACSAYTYERHEGKLLFTKTGKSWGYHATSPHPAHRALDFKVREGSVAAWDAAALVYADYYSKYDKQGNPL